MPHPTGLCRPAGHGGDGAVRSHTQPPRRHGQFAEGRTEPAEALGTHWPPRQPPSRLKSPLGTGTAEPSPVGAQTLQLRPAAPGCFEPAGLGRGECHARTCAPHANAFLLLLLFLLLPALCRPRGPSLPDPTSQSIRHLLRQVLAAGLGTAPGVAATLWTPGLEPQEPAAAAPGWEQQGCMDWVHW